MTSCLTSYILSPFNYSRIFWLLCRCLFPYISSNNLQFILITFYPSQLLSTMLRQPDSTIVTFCFLKSTTQQSFYCCNWQPLFAFVSAGARVEARTCGFRNNVKAFYTRFLINIHDFLKLCSLQLQNVLISANFVEIYHTSHSTVYRYYFTASLMSVFPRILRYGARRLVNHKSWRHCPVRS